MTETPPVLVEVLHFEGCPHFATLIAHLGLLLAGTPTRIVTCRVESPAAAERERFLGSPTVRIRGMDVEPGADGRSDFGLKCRLYPTARGLRGAPDDEWILAALAGALRGESTR